MEFVDTHCHLQFDKLQADLEGVVKRAKAAGVSRLICVGTGLRDSRQAADIAADNDNVWAAAGSHPHEAETIMKMSAKGLQDEMRRLLAAPKIVAVGEIGLDYYKDYAPRLAQEKALRALIESSLPNDLPFIFHVRDAWSDFWRIFDEYKNLRGVVHSFSSGTKQLNSALERGIYIGLNGIMTFTRDEAQLEAARQVPLEKLLLETDAPFLAPAPFRSQTCEPKHVADTTKFLAELRDQPVNQLAKASTANAVSLFGLK